MTSGKMNTSTRELQGEIDALVAQYGLQRVVDAVSRNARNKKYARLDSNARLKQVKALMDDGLTNGDIAMRLQLSRTYVSQLCSEVRQREAVSS